MIHYPAFPGNQGSGARDFLLFYIFAAPIGMAVGLYISYIDGQGAGDFAKAAEGAAEPRKKKSEVEENPTVKKALEVFNATVVSTEGR